MTRMGIAVVLLGAFGCATATRLHTSPEGATVYVDGLYMGKTPLRYDNDPGLPRRYHLQLFKEGYEPLDLYIDARLSYLWGALGAITLVPYLWAWSLRGDYVFKLRPSSEPPSSPTGDTAAPASP